ncbi:hypothetical protein ANN_02607 [Periplaneta americana]|uniref:Uncharacterized protein n=1 Tax=Periplaneta americana TaxID=6978 RepID=A0ABQ8TWV3_PERAM|nr:hypothetical protein ANN_02607 [Periplaneta americana]
MLSLIFLPGDNSNNFRLRVNIGQSESSSVLDDSGANSNNYKNTGNFNIKYEDDFYVRCHTTECLFTKNEVGVSNAGAKRRLVYHSQPNIQDELEMEKVLEALRSHRCGKLLTVMLGVFHKRETEIVYDDEYDDVLCVGMASMRLFCLKQFFNTHHHIEERERERGRLKTAWKDGIGDAMNTKDIGAIHRNFTSPRYERAKLVPAIEWLLTLVYEYEKEDDILEAFDLLIEKVDDLLSAILNYIKDKTTNTCEAWHRRINRPTFMGKPHPSFFHVLQQLQNEVAVIDRDIERLQSDFSPTKEKRKYRYLNTDAGISRIVERYKNYINSDDILGYLLPIGQNIAGNF